MKFVSACSGIEAASAAWHPLGWDPVAFSEIEPFPSAVLAHRFPDVPNLGNLLNHEEWKLGRGACDVLVAGTPCQSFSVAGLRRGLRDPRGNITLAFLGLVAQLCPRWVVWENVPGILSDSSNAFGQLISGLQELGYDCAWRVLDAQYFGVPQRRRRVFLVANPRAYGIHPAQVLFEPESLSRDLAPRKAEREETAKDIAGCLGGSSQSGGFRTTDLDNSGAFIPTIAFTADGETADPLCYKEQQTYTNEGKMFRLRNCIGEFLGVRRLTVTECERLQGFPDGWTDIEYRGKPAKDAPRYKALGNSMAVPVMRWIGERIAEVDRKMDPDENCAPSGEAPGAIEADDPEPCQDYSEQLSFL